MKPNIQVQSERLKRLFALVARAVISGLAFASFIAVPRSSHGAYTPKPNPSLAQRVANVRHTLEKITPSPNHSSASAQTMQWYNWNNFGNWPNWGNWNNWANWGKWVNW